MRPPDEVLYDSEAALRLVNHAIEELGAPAVPLDADTNTFIAHVCSQPGGFGELSRRLVKAHAEGLVIAQQMEDSHSALEQAMFDKLQQVHGKLEEVSSATEVATTDILNGLSRGVALVERILGEEGVALESRNKVLGTLRDELYGVMEYLQFQDITTQQLSHSASLLVEMRQRMSEMVNTFAPFVGTAGTAAVPVLAPISPFDPHATTSVATTRQQVVNEVLAALAEHQSD